MGNNFQHQAEKISLSRDRTSERASVRTDSGGGEEKANATRHRGRECCVWREWRVLGCGQPAFFWREIARNSMSFLKERFLFSETIVPKNKSFHLRKDNISIVMSTNDSGVDITLRQGLTEAQRERERQRQRAIINRQ